MADATQTTDTLAGWTPGPWELAPATCFLGDAVAPVGWTGISGGNWFDFALVCTRMADDAFDHPQGVANARLIAAAPAMAEAHDKIANGDWLGVQRFAEDSDGDFLLRVIAEMRKLARAALRLAKEGR